MVRPIVEVAINVPLRKLFHYEVPERLAGELTVGHRVLVPFGPRTATGVCVAFPRESEVAKLKPVRKILHPDCRFDAHLLELTRWIAEYYHAPWGEVLDAALPPSIKNESSEPLVAWIRTVKPPDLLAAEANACERRAAARARVLRYLAARPGEHARSRVLEDVACSGAVVQRLVADGWIEEERRPRLDPLAIDAGTAAVAPPERPALNAEQSRALAAILQTVRAGGFQPFLLHGITGSGKTEVYLRALLEVLAAGKRGLVLVPEISLTPQTLRRFRLGLAGEKVAVLHSMLTARERREEWRTIQSGEAKLIIGARSSIFAPAGDLGLIVVDEEHDSSYKQESSPRYHARDVAVVRAKMLGIPVVLGSATPTLESLQNARAGRYRLLTLSRRATSHDLPAVRTTPLGAEFYRLDGSGLISDALDVQIRKNLRDGEQVLLFLNRRGFATYLHCCRCGFVLQCDDCDIALTYHRRDNLAHCHYCDHRRAVPEQCPECNLPNLLRSGVGTEKITAELARRYGEARVARLDRDSVSNYGTLQEVLARFGAGEFDILVGTQMIAKGHDFPNVTLVGIINADTGLHFPDFRSAERTFQLITQVSGRAGRGERRGRVLIQTFTPDHYAIACAARGDLETFVTKELGFRKSLGYPPFGRLVKIQLQGDNVEQVAAESQHLAEILRAHAAGCRVLGPAPSPIAKIQGRYRYQILIKSPSSRSLHAVLARLDEATTRKKSGVERAIDVDPQSML